MSDDSDTRPASESALAEILGASPPPRWRPYIRYGAPALLLVLIVLLVLYWTGGNDSPEYATAQVRRDDLTVDVAATGNLAPTNEVEVSSEQSGLITDVFVDNNDRVTKGQPLARLDTARLRDTIEQNEAALLAARAQVAQAQAQQAQAQANYQRIENVYRLSGGKVPSETERETARAAARSAIAAVQSAQASVRQAQAALSSSRTNLSKATIYSPVNGVVLSRSVDPGQTVAASFSAPVLFTIAEDLSRMRLEVQVDEADVGQVKAGQQASFTVDAFPGEEFPARIVRVDVGANASETGTSASSASDVVSYTAVLLVANPNLKLRPGMTATANIVTQKASGLVVPNAALRFRPEAGARQGQTGGVTSVLGPARFRRDRGEQEVKIGRGSRQNIYVLDENGEPQAVSVTVGASDGSFTIVSGNSVRAGMKVVTAVLAGEK